MDNPRRYRSFFWPTVLIGVGLVWLLANLGIISPVSINSILRLWPLILIVLGLDLLFGHRASWAGALIGILAVAAVIGFLVFGTQLGIQTSNTAMTETFSEPAGDASSANFYLELSSEPVEIYSLTASDKLIDAKIGHTGTIDFSVTGDQSKTVRIAKYSDPGNWLTWDFSLNSLKWDIGLTPALPVDITLDGGSGSVNADLSGLQLNSLHADMGSGSSRFTLPRSDQAYEAVINSGSGSVSLDLPAETNLTLYLDSGSGSLNVNLPKDTAVMIEVLDSGSGSLNLPDVLQSVSGSYGDGMGKWQTAGYDSAAVKIHIQVTNRGSGSVNFR